MSYYLKHLVFVLVLLFLVRWVWADIDLELNTLSSSAKEPIVPIPNDVKFDQAKVKLGEKLFNDQRLSRSNKMACATCHILSQGGDDGLSRSVTNSGQPDLINAPTVFNSGLNFRQTWRGKFRTLEQQAEGDLRNPRHGNTDWDDVLPKLKNDKDYQVQFSEVYFSKGITRETVLNAIATFERSLLTPDSDFDLYLKGNKNAISDNAKKGYNLFKTYGCIACHQGMNVGGNMFQRIGVLDEYFTSKKKITKADLGRFNVTGNENDKFVFKVPSLRNVQLTAPYFHDGSVATLESAVKKMGRVQLGLEIPDEDIVKIVDFLKTLTGKYKGKSLLKQSKD